MPPRAVNFSLPDDPDRAAAAAANGRFDRLGALVSALCALHCLVVPLAFAAVPSLTLALYAWSHPAHGIAIALLYAARYEWLAASLAAGMALSSTFRGWLRHRAARPIACALGGGALLLCAALSPLAQRDGSWHALFAVTGGLCLVAAHLLNLWATRRWIAGIAR
ncbi:MAG: MerC domain-containing protein [Rudaea sp.]|uniref:MerC domain-containing protein n=1 Tax=Rudaea sp. TaxID=2136325 RepID=UPI0039E31710